MCVLREKQFLRTLVPLAWAPVTFDLFCRDYEPCVHTATVPNSEKQQQNMNINVNI